MKAMLEFELPEDQCEFKVACDGGKWRAAVRALDEWLRDKLKYGHEFATADAALEEARKLLHEEISGGGLSLDE